MARFEWANVDVDACGRLTERARAEIHTSDGLREIGDDGEQGPFGDVVGVSVRTGSDGVMLWGPREALLTWAQDVVDRLRAGEGLPDVDAEVVDHELGDGGFTVGEVAALLDPATQRRALEGPR